MAATEPKPFRSKKAMCKAILDWRGQLGSFGRVLAKAAKDAS